jgi:hypothetical protein
VSVVGELNARQAEFAFGDWQLLGWLSGTVKWKNHPPTRRPLDDLDLCELLSEDTSLILREGCGKCVENHVLVWGEIAE